MKRPGSVVIVLAATALLVAILELAGARRDNPLAIGGAAPEIGLPRLDRPADTVRLSDLRGKVVLLETWNTACANCRSAMPAAERLAEEYGPQGLMVIHVAGEDLSDSVAMRRYLGEIGVNGIVVVDNERHFASSYQTWAVPWSVLVDREGKVAWQRPGVVADADHPLSTEQGRRLLLEVLRKRQFREVGGERTLGRALTEKSRAQ